MLKGPKQLSQLFIGVRDSHYKVSIATSATMSTPPPPTTTSDVFAAKKLLRKEMKQVLSRISKEEKTEQSNRVTEKLFTDAAYIQSR